MTGKMEETGDDKEQKMIICFLISQTKNLEQTIYWKVTCRSSFFYAIHLLTQGNIRFPGYE